MAIVIAAGIRSKFIPYTPAIKARGRKNNEFLAREHGCLMGQFFYRIRHRAGAPPVEMPENNKSVRCMPFIFGVMAGLQLVSRCHFARLRSFRGLQIRAGIPMLLFVCKLLLHNMESDEKCIAMVFYTAISRLYLALYCTGDRPVRRLNVMRKALGSV